MWVKDSCACDCAASQFGDGFPYILCASATVVFCDVKACGDAACWDYLAGK